MGCPWQSSECHSDEVHRRVLCLPVGSLTDLWLEFIAEQGMGDRRGKGSSKGGDRVQGEFGDLNKFHDSPQFMPYAKDQGK